MSSALGADAFNAWLFYGGRHSSQFKDVVAAHQATLAHDLAHFARLVLDEPSGDEELAASLRQVAGFIRASGISLSTANYAAGSASAETVAWFVDLVAGEMSYPPVTLDIQSYDGICAFIESLVQQDIAMKNLTGFAVAFERYEALIQR